MTRLVAARANLAAGLRGGQELLLWSSTAAPARRTQRANVLLAVPGLLEQIEGRIDANPLRQERTPGFDLAVVAATVARTPDTPSPAANGLRRVGRFVSDHRRDLLLGVDGWRAGPGAADDCHRGAVGVVAVVFRHGSARHDARRGSAGSWMFCARGGGYPPAHAGLEYGQQWRGSVRSVDRDYDRWCVGPGLGDMSVGQAVDDHERNPEYELHVGRIVETDQGARRYVSVWLRGRRFHGWLIAGEPEDSRGESS
jgi:hypothetical protein